MDVRVKESRGLRLVMEKLKGVNRPGTGNYVPCEPV